ncbi:MAG: FAD-dependent oxidoreductase [Gemmatimonadaceae bacterium]
MADVIVVGAGIAGLVCAIELMRAGKSVVVLEKENDVGGRARSSVIDGCIIDHGFQVLFTAYPTLKSYLDIPALQLRSFRPAAHVISHGRQSLIGDALRDPTLLMDAVAPGVIPMADKLRLLALRRFAKQLTIEECFDSSYTSISTRNFLFERGFSATVIDGFFAPFYGGILLDRTLSTNAGILLFSFKMLSEGDTAVPARGMGAIAQQLADLLPEGAVRTGVCVRSLLTNDQGVQGVVLDDGSTLAAVDVVLAVATPAAVPLASTAGVVMDAGATGVGDTSLYFVSNRAPLRGKSLWLNGDMNAVISHAITLTEVAPEYAPGKSLLVATALGKAAHMSDELLEQSARKELAHFATVASASPLPEMKLAVIWRVPYSQFVQPPGFQPSPAAISSNVRGLWRASELLHSSSLEGAARGGRAAAMALLGMTAGTNH